MDASPMARPIEACSSLPRTLPPFMMATVAWGAISYDVVHSTPPMPWITVSARISPVWLTLGYGNRMRGPGWRMDRRPISESLGSPCQIMRAGERSFKSLVLRSPRGEASLLSFQCGSIVSCPGRILFKSQLQISLRLRELGCQLEGLPELGNGI
jgi:hypothetical protein